MPPVRYRFEDIPVTVVTQADLDAQAEAARRLAPPPPMAEYAENPRWPWEPAAPADAVGIDCSELDHPSREGEDARP